jgi:hypothetical protein
LPVNFKKRLFMKNFKLLFATLLLMAVTSISATKPLPQEPAPTKPIPRGIKVYFLWLGAAHSPAIDFVCGTTSSTELSTSSNWDNGSSSNASCSSPNHKICTICIEILLGSQPPKQDIINEVKAEYDRLAGLGQTFTDGYNWNPTIGGSSIRIVIYLKF